MTDIVERLREGRTDGTALRWTVTDIHREAADEIERLRLALRIIAGYEQCIDNLMSNGDVARAALTKKEKIMEPTLSLSEAKAVVATKIAPRVTEESIRAKIVSVEYLMPEIINDFCSEDMTTICKIRMTNGFVFIGHSTPASAANFDAEVSKRYAYENAFKQIWTHEGYLLRERLSER